MAVVLGTSSGFVTVAPTVDPNGTGVAIDGSKAVTKDTSPSTAVKITEIGWWRTGTNAANFEVGLYAEAAGVAGALLFVDATNSDTSGGWVRVTVDWAISGSTAYWLGLQMDAHGGSSTVDSATSGGAGIDIVTSATALTDPFGGGAVSDADGMYSIYALWQPAGTDHTIDPADSLGFADARAITQGKGVADTLALADARTLAQGKAISDTETLSDSFARVYEAVRAMDDSIALGDATAMQRGSVLADTLALSDFISTDLVGGGQGSYSTIDPSRIGAWV